MLHNFFEKACNFFFNKLAEKKELNVAPPSYIT